MDPKKRPSAEQILHMPVFIAKYNEHKSDLQNSENMADPLLGTIKVPKNLNLLGERLPKAQYDDIPEVREERQSRLDSRQDDSQRKSAGSRQVVDRSDRKPPL